MADEADQQVDDAVTRMQALLDELKGAQSKDEQEEGKEEKPARDLREAEQRAYTRVRAHIRALRQKEST